MTVDFTRRATFGLAGIALLPGVTLAAATAPASLDIRTADGRLSRITRWRAHTRRGTILFSHGALSSPAKYIALIEPWVDAGFDVWAPLHVDSTDHPDTKSYPGLASWPARIEDMRALAAHIGAGHYVAAGHSYGALVALTLGGVSPTRPAGVTGPLADPRVTSVVAFSPPGPGMGLVDATGYATLAAPALIETGTRDIPPGVPPTADGWRTHLAAFEATKPGGDRFAMVLDDADHYFGGIICRPELPGPKQRVPFAQAVEQSLLFLGGYGIGDRRARQLLVASAAQAAPIAPGLYRR